MDVGSAFSQASSLTDKFNLNNAKNLISSGVDKLSGTVQGLFNKSPAATIETQMPKGMPRVPSTTETAPPPEKSTAPLGALTYPMDLKYFTMFKFSRYERVLATDVPKEKLRVPIILPMPSNLAESFNVKYDTPALGAVAGAASEAFVDGLRQLQGAGPASNRGEQATLGGVAASAIVNRTINRLKELGAVKNSTVAADITRKAIGLTPNPYLAVIFNNIDLRKHQFTYRFAPNSLKELETVKKIIQQFKISMLPGYLSGSADMTFTFPDTCEITFGPDKHRPYRIKKCVLENMSVNYSPNGPAFFKTGDPVIVEISLSFQEIEPYTRKDEDPSSNIKVDTSPLNSLMDSLKAAKQTNNLEKRVNASKPIQGAQTDTSARDAGLIQE